MTNGEKFKTANERENAFWCFCEENVCLNGCPLYKSLSDATRAKRTNSICHFAWLDLEADEKPQESFEDLLKEVREFADSFIVNGEDKGLENPCDTLHEIADRFEAAHNRVAKAVKAAKEWGAK